MARTKKKAEETIRPKNSADELRKSITDKIVDALNSGITPWNRPWSNDPNSGFPTNIVSKKRYSGINPLLLEITSIIRKFSSKWWGTYEQWANLGGQVQKRPKDVEPGDWGTTIVFYKIFEVDDKKPDGTPFRRKVFLLRNYTVFNLDQVDGDKLDKYRATKSDVTIDDADVDFTAAKSLIKSTGATINYGGNKAYYLRPSPVDSFPNHTGGDYIQMPHMKQFMEPSEFFVTHFHELAHWSEQRLNWKDTYEMGELVAEITASYLANETRVPNYSQDNHNKYLAGWLSKMQSNPKWIFDASRQASKVADYLLSFENKVETEEMEDENED